MATDDDLKKKNLSFALHNKSCFEIIFVTIDWYIRCAKKIETLFPKKTPKLLSTWVPQVLAWVFLFR